MLQPDLGTPEKVLLRVPGTLMAFVLALLMPCSQNKHSSVVERRC